MEFVDKYLMPHKEKIVLIIIVILAEYLVTPELRPLASSFIAIGATLLYAWIGWDGQKRLQYNWKDSAIAGMSIAIFTEIIAILIRIVIGTDNIFWQERSARGLAGYFVIHFIVFVLTVLVGHAAAKYLAPNAAPKKAVAEHQRKH